MAGDFTDILIRKRVISPDQLAEAKASSDTLAKYRKQLEQDPRDFVANPDGKITVVEFFDYRCGYCKLAAPQVLQLIKDHPDVRFVFKEFPIFGADSDLAAAAAIAVKQAGGDYLGVYSDLMSARPLNADAVQHILKTHGVDPAQLQQAAFQKEASDQLLATRKLAVALGVEGTPAFIVGNSIIPGEDMDAVRAAINTARARKG